MLDSDVLFVFELARTAFEYCVANDIVRFHFLDYFGLGVY